jgi:hypothetical protein
MLCYNHLRMIGHASMLYRTQFGRTPKSLEELVASRCAPAPFVQPSPHGDKDAFFCPCGGKYSLSADGTTGVCTHHGHAQQLVPCLEIPQERVTAKEADEYRQFLTAYSQYWRRYFDPIAIRLQVSPKQYRAETIILPLIDNSIYTSLAMAMGGSPEPLDALPVPKRNIFSMVMRLNKEPMLKQGLLKSFLSDRQISNSGIKPPRSTDEFLTKGIGNQVGLNAYDSSPMFDFNLPGFLGEMTRSFNPAGRMREEAIYGSFLISSLNSPVYISVPVKDAKIVDKFLDELDDSMAALARLPEPGFFSFKHDFYKTPMKGSKQPIRCYGIELEGIVKWRMFYGRVGNGLYIASKQCILEDLAAMPAVPAAKTADEGPTAHAMMRIRPGHWNEVLPEFRLGWEENSRHSCINNLGPLSSVARAVSADGKAKAGELHEAADRLYAVHFFCPDGGRYQLGPDGHSVTCSVHGSAAAPRQLNAPAAGSSTGRLMQDLKDVTAELTFLEDGLHAVITIGRK